MPKTGSMEGAAGLSLRHLRIFETVAKLQNVNKAAEVVHLTQSAVTQAIAKLEWQLHARLFERSNNGTYLTEAGRVFAARVEAMFAQIEEALTYIGAATPGQSSASIAERITRPQIRALSAIARGDVAGDPSNVDISKASLLRAARQLERCIGKPLLRQSADRLSTTEMGADFARKLRLAMREVELGIEEISDKAEQRDNRLRVGAMRLTGTFMVASVLNNLMTHFPNAQIDLRGGDRANLIEELRRGEIDIIVGLLFDPANSDRLIQEPLVPLPYVIVAQPNHPLAGRTKLTRADFEGYNWVAPNYDTARRAAFDRLAESLQIPPTATIQTTSLPTVRFLLSESHRLALLTRFEFEHAKGAGDLITLPFGPIEPAPWLGITHRANWAPTPLHLQFIELIRREATKIAKSNTAAQVRLSKPARATLR